MTQLDSEDEKLVTLARAAAGRVGGSDGAAVRDLDGRTYAAAPVALPSLRLSALQLAVAQAVAAGAQGLEAAAVTGIEAADAEGLSAVRDLAAEAPVFAASGEQISQAGR